MRRHVLGSLIVLAITAIAWFAWQIDTRRHVRAADARLAAAGWPTTPTDFDARYLAPVDPADDAAPLLLRAAELLAQKEPFRSSNHDAPPGSQAIPPYFDLWFQLNRGVAADPDVIEALPLLHAAADRPDADWGLSAGGFEYEHFNGQRQCANVLTDLAKLAAHDGDPAEAVRLWLDTAALADHLRSPMLIHELVATGIDALIASSIIASAPSFDLSGADPADVRRLIARLLDDTTDAEQMLAGEYLSTKVVVQDGLYSSTPTLLAAQRRQLPRMVAIHLDTADRMTGPRVEPEPRDEVSGAFPNLLDDGPAGLADRLASVSSGFDRAVTTVRRARFERRVAAIALAWAMHRAEHGSPPGSLDDLVPAYLPAVPRDPFDPAGGPVGFAWLRWPDGSPRPVVWSVADDATPDLSAGWRDGEPPDAWPDGEPRWMGYAWLSHTEGNVPYGSSRATTDDQPRDLSLPPAAVRAALWEDYADERAREEGFGGFGGFNPYEPATAE